jgi:hypothetical protein
MEKPALLLCPFCGGNPIHHMSDPVFHEDSSVRCQQCGVVVLADKTDGHGLYNVVADWNRRTAPQPTLPPSPEDEILPSPRRRAEMLFMLEAPAGVNTDRLDDATLAILTLSILQNDHPGLPGIQVDPEFDLLTLARLYAKGFLATEPHAPVHAIWLTPEGARRAHELFRKLFCD